MSKILDLTEAFRDHSIMTLPLTSQSKTIGVLQIRKKGQSKGFTENEIKFCRLITNSAAIALKNAQLFQDLESRNQELSLKKAELESLSKELQSNNRKLIELQKLKEDFSAMIVHDIKSPLTIIRGVLETLGHRLAKTPDEKDIIQDAVGETKRIISLINNLLEIAKIESGEMRLRKEEVDMGEVIRSSLEPLNILAQERNIKLKHRIPAKLPPVVADREKIVQILSNLLANAIEHVPDNGTITVKAEGLPRSEPQGKETIRVSVEDSGPGIPKEELPQIFDRFKQGNQPGRKGGTGLGLAIVEFLVRAHEGSIAVESEVGKGSTFMVTLPASTLH
jgi:signal transduction histidine kinase